MFKFVARQVVASEVMRASKLKFVAESRTRVYFAQHVCFNLQLYMYFAARQVGLKRGKTRNNVAKQDEEKCCAY